MFLFFSTTFRIVIDRSKIHFMPFTSPKLFAATKILITNWLSFALVHRWNPMFYKIALQTLSKHGTFLKFSYRLICFDLSNSMKIVVTDACNYTIITWRIAVKLESFGGLQCLNKHNYESWPGQNVLFSPLGRRQWSVFIGKDAVEAFKRVSLQNWPYGFFRQFKNRYIKCGFLCWIKTTKKEKQLFSHFGRHFHWKRCSRSFLARVVSKLTLWVFWSIWKALH